MSKICVLGSYSGRNAGDTAILGNLLADISAQIPEAQFIVPTPDPRFVYTHFGHYNIKAPGLLPWNGALKIFGWPTLLSMITSDVVLITDNALFDRKFFNPLINFLSTIALYSPLCKKRKIPIVFYNASVGPITTELGAKALQVVLDASPLIILRDPKTREIFQEWKLNFPEPIVHADCALNTVPTSGEDLNRIIKKEGLFKNPKGTVSFNINAYIDNWSSDGTLTVDQFLAMIGQSINYTMEKYGTDVILLVTQIMDYKISEQIMNHVHAPKNVRIISNKNYTFHDIVGLLQHVDLHVGLRTHSLIFSAAVHTPMISINSYPKNEGFMRSIGQDDWMIEFAGFNAERLNQTIDRAWHQRSEISERLKKTVPLEQNKAKHSAVLLHDFLVSS